MEETISSRIPWKERVIYKLVSSMSSGDILIVPELSRLGRSMLDPYRAEIEKLLSQGSTQAYIAKLFNTTPANLNRYLKKRNVCSKTSLYDV